MPQIAPPHSLRAGLSWCLCNGQPVFLDLARDRYFCLPAALDPSFRRWSTGAPFASEALDRLVACGILESGGPGPTPATPHPPALRDLATTRPHGHTLSDIVAAIALQFAARRALKRAPLSAIVARLEARRPGTLADGDDESPLRRVAGAFVASAVLLRAQDQCLPRAIAAMRLCHHLGQPAALVFGVRINPFAAHSWVQWKDAVVVGDLETVRLYTPILVVA